MLITELLELDMLTWRSGDVGLSMLKLYTPQVHMCSYVWLDYGALKCFSVRFLDEN